MYAVSSACDLAVVVRPQREPVLSIDIVSISKRVELNGDPSVKGTLLQHFEIEIASYLERFTKYELVCDDQMLLVVTWSRDHKQYSFIGISIQSCELKYHKSLTITKRCHEIENGYFILNGNNGTNGLLLFNVGDEERKLQMYSLDNNFELISECKVDYISQFNENDYLTFQVSNDVLFISSDGTRSIHVIECSYAGLYEKHRLKVLFGCESDSFCDFSVVFNGFEAVVFNQRYVNDEEYMIKHETYVDVYNIPESSFSLIGLCRLAIKNMVKSKKEIESLPIPNKIKKELSNMI